MASILQCVEPLFSARTAAETCVLARAHLVGRPFGDMLDEKVLEHIRTTKSKGVRGHVCERLAGIRLSTDELDFRPFGGYEGGEMKMIPVRKDGTPIPGSTVCVLQLNPVSLDEIVSGVRGSVERKLRDMVIVSLFCEGDPAGWYVVRVTHVCEADPAHASLYAALRRDLRSAGCDMTEQFDAAGVVGHGTTARGRVVQVRTKDSSTSNPRALVSRDLGVRTAKGFAVYLTATGARALLAVA